MLGISRLLLRISWLLITLAVMPLHAQIYTDLHDFNCALEGCNPTYPEILVQGRDGNLYGTTNEGGVSNMGTVFMATPFGAITTLHNFSGADGQNPNGGLTLGPDGNFYGSTRIGGAANNGTIFKITPAGVFKTLYSFSNTGDGSNPYASPVLGKNGSFYGTTCSQFGPWTAYSITSAGVFKTLTGFVPPCSFAPLLLGSDGNFYGTSQVGGTTYQGTVFRLTPAGAITVLYSFDYTHGAYLYSPLAQGKDGFLYGTTSGGGSGQVGVIFKMSLSGNLLLLHQFDESQGSDGATPFAGLVAASDGNFYGATSGGANFGPIPAGAVFRINSTGSSYSNLYAFHDDSSNGTLLDATSMQHTNGKFYGLPGRGGIFAGGVLYSLDNGVPPFAALVTLFGNTGQQVGIRGQGFAGTTAVHFGSAVATFTVMSDSFLTASIPVNATTGFVKVTTASATLTSSQQFHVVPTISNIAPISGPVGTVVTVTGTGFLGTTQVTFGGVKATTFTVNSASTVTATVPEGAATGKVGVQTPGGAASSSATFTVTP